MKVSKEILQNWEDNLDQGDKGKLVDYTGFSFPTITTAFNGEASEELIKKINQFFKEKKERIEASFKNK